MTDATIHDIIIVTPPTLAALAALIASLRTGKKTDAIHILVDGQLAEWRKEKDREIADVKISAEASGVLKESDRRATSDAAFEAGRQHERDRK